MEGSSYYRVYIMYHDKMLGITEKLSEVVEMIEDSMREIKNGRYMIIQHFNELNMDNPFGTISNPQELLKLKEKATLEEQTPEDKKDDVSGRVKVLH